MSESSSAPPRDGKGRKIITTACTPCRKRKSRCDGEVPVCQMCAIYKTAELCTYDKQSDRRKLRTKHQAEVMETRIKTLEALFTKLRTCPADELQEFVRNLRDEEVTTPSTNSGAMSDTAIKIEDRDILQQVDDLHLDEDGEVHYYGATSNLPLIGLPAPAQPIEAGFSRASVSEQAERLFSPVIVEALLDLYWSWQHPYFQVLDRRLFLRDRAQAAREGFPPTKRKFYSEFLLCAILALTSHLYHNQNLSTHPNDPRSAGNVYYERARQLMDSESLRPGLCTIQGCLILSSREAGLGRQSRGWLYSGMAFRMALDLGLHVRKDQCALKQYKFNLLQVNCEKLVQEGKMSTDELHVRSVTFWGAFLYDAGWSSYIGRPTSLPMAASSCPRPVRVQVPYDCTPFELRNNLVFEEEIKLTELLLKVVAIRNSVKEDVRKALWKNLQDWNSHAATTDMSKIMDDAIHPCELMLYLVFETTIILLFRDIAASSAPAVSFVDAKREYVDAAFRALAILERYSALFGLDKVTNMAIHLTFTVATTFLLALMDDPHPRELYYKSLGRCLEFFLEIEQTWQGAASPRRGIVGKMRQMGLAVPELYAQGISNASWLDVAEHADVSPLSIHPGEQQWGGFTADDYVHNSLDLRNTYSSLNNFRRLYNAEDPTGEAQVYSSLSGHMF